MVGDRCHLGRGRLGNAVRSQFSRPRLGDWSVRLLSNVEAALVGAMGVGCDDEMRKKKEVWCVPGPGQLARSKTGRDWIVRWLLHLVYPWESLDVRKEEGRDDCEVNAEEEEEK